MKSENVSDKNRANKNLFFYKKNEKREKNITQGTTWSNKEKDKISKILYLIFKIPKYHSRKYSHIILTFLNITFRSVCWTFFLFVQGMQNITNLMIDQHFLAKKNKFSSPFDLQKNPKKVQHIDLNVMFIKHEKICVDLLEWCFSISKIR